MSRRKQRNGQNGQHWLVQPILPIFLFPVQHPHPIQSPNNLDRPCHNIRLVIAIKFIHHGKNYSFDRQTDRHRINKCHDLADLLSEDRSEARFPLIAAVARVIGRTNQPQNVFFVKCAEGSSGGDDDEATVRKTYLCLGAGAPRGRASDRGREGGRRITNEKQLHRV